MKLVIIFWVFYALFSCINAKHKRNENSQDTLTSSVVQEKSRILFERGGNVGNDSIFVWMDSTLGFVNCKIIRIKDAGYYKYFFWNTGRNMPVLFLQDSIPVVEFVSDTLFDVNGDNTKDLLVNGQFMNGQCAPRYSKLFCFDRTTNVFIEIPIVRTIPNPKFFPSKKLLTGEIDCMMRTDIYKFRWLGLKLDTISIISKPLD